MKFNCMSCGKEIDCSKSGECYSDEGSMAISHGLVQCKECYSKDHKFCPRCEKRPLANEWSFCPWCGIKVS